MKYNRIFVIGLGTIEVGQQFIDPFDNRFMIYVTKIEIYNSCGNGPAQPDDRIMIEGYFWPDKDKKVFRTFCNVGFMISPEDLIR